MFLSVGTDIQEIARFEPLLKNKKFVKRCFTDAERAYLDGPNVRPAESAAAAYCAKEAFAKAVGTGIDPEFLTSVEVLHAESGQPYLKLYGVWAEKYGDLTLSVSLSHSANYAVATVLAYRVEEGSGDGGNDPD